MRESTVSSTSAKIGSTRTSKEEGDLLYYGFMTFLVIVLTAIMLSWGGQPQLTLAIIILLIIGLNLLSWLYGKTDEAVIWEQEEELSEELNLKLAETSDLFRRASQGMELSQGLLEKKVRNLFMSKLKDEKNLSQEEIRELLQNPEDFRRVVDDEVISDFVLSKLDDQEDVKKEMDKEYEDWILGIIESIERWK